MSKPTTSDLTPSSPNAAALPPKLNLGFDVCACSFGGYPWDDWQLARSLVGSPPEGTTEDDLFAGLRERVRR